MPCRPTDTHIRYGHSTWAVDDPGALVMADRPVQPGLPGRTWRAGERPDSTVIMLTQVLVVLGDSESTTHGPWRRPSHFVLLCRARTPEGQPPTLPHLSVQCDTCLAQARPAEGQGRAGQGQPLSRRSFPCSRDTLLLFRLRPVGADNAWLSASQHPIQWSPPQDCW